MMNKHLLPILFFFSLFTTTIQAQWTSQYSNTSINIYALKAVDENTVWAAAGKGNIIRTTDGGETWIPTVIPGADTLAFWSIAAIDADTAYVAGGSYWVTRLYKTTDGGQSWEMQFESGEEEIISIAFWDGSNGIIETNLYYEGKVGVHTTSDGGVTWNRTPQENIPSLFPGEFPGFMDSGGRALTVAGSDHAWFGTAYGNGSNDPIRVYRSTDKGQTWTAVNTDLSTLGQFHGIGSMVFLDTLNGYAANGGTGPGEQNSLAQTTDGGLTWNTMTSFSKKSVTLAHIPDPDAKTLIVATFSGPYYSNDSGATWTEISSDFVFRFSFASPTAGWGVSGDQHQILHYTGQPLVTSTWERLPTTGIPVDLTMIYPNPTKKEGIILFSLDRQAPVRLEVISESGQVVAVLLEERLGAGDHQVSFDLADLPAGMYLCRLQTGNYTAGKKLMIAK
ncbi:MAG: T9SS type A sorting domain-containing protein [Saprospiraceae bacterium]|nr:T9SS type A sorting domain-containing protein [Lewinella sp.]